MNGELRLYYQRWVLELGYEFLPNQNFRRPSGLAKVGVGYRFQ
jgi:hypothetical protein